TIALLAAYGTQGTPRARVVRETFRDWFSIIRQAQSEPNLINDIRVAWAKAKQQLSIDNAVGNIRGIMSNVVYILNQAQWNPRTFDCWEDPLNNQWVIKDFKTAPDIVAAAVSRTFLDNELPRAAKHHDGQGLQEGVDTENTLRYLRRIRTYTSVEYSYKAMLETILSGAMWPASRITSINPFYNNLCQRCKTEPETSLHTFWTCPCNNDIDEPIILQTNKYIQYAVQEAQVYPCMWFRGILPNKFTDLDIPEPTNELCVTHIQQEQAHWNSGIYYGDASGGEHTQYNSLRRIGVGFILADADGGMVHGAHFNLPGAIQTVTRGELFALVVLLRFLEPLSSIEFVTDNFNVYRTFKGGPAAGINSANCDLYEEAFRITYDRAIQVNIRWMPSH
ncbi:MAG: hypothetical protein QF535_15560, partial [Anaerolineales bacterium]|nr:hypothetical protein [Anaerolineales bacterium]